MGVPLSLLEVLVSLLGVLYVGIFASLLDVLLVSLLGGLCVGAFVFLLGILTS